MSSLSQLKNLSSASNSKHKWKGKGILLEVGHGGNDRAWEPGAVWKAVREYDLNFVAAKAAKAVFDLEGVPCTISDYVASLWQIGQQAQGYQVFCSIHHNASAEHKAQGVEAYYHQKKGGYPDRRLALLIGRSLSKAMGLRLRDDVDGDIYGDRGMQLGVLSGAEDTNCEACVLAECYFMDHDLDHILWSTNAGRAIAAGILEYLKEKE